MADVMVNAHNPMTGPRHLAHYICIKDYLAAEEQEEYESFYIVDDLAAYVMWPLSREQVLNRSMHTVKDFLAAGVNPERSSIVFTSMLPESLELMTLLNLHIDLQYCTDLWRESFLGRLLSYQRTELGLPKYPSVTEVVYSQTSLAALTLGLQTDEFTGGEEMLGYMPIMKEIVHRFKESTDDWLKLPEMELVKFPFVLGTDGRHMGGGNALFLASEPGEIGEVVNRIPDTSVLRQWYEGLDAPERANELSPSGSPTAKELSAAVEFFTQALEKFRTFHVTNDELLAILRQGVQRARPRLTETIHKVRSAHKLPPGG